MIYFLILFFLFILFYLYDVLHITKGVRFFWFFSFALLVLVAGLRFKVGGDTFSYLNNYEYFPTFFEFASFDFENARYDFFWYVFCAICKLFSKSYFFMQFMHAFLINIAFFYFIKKYIKYKFLGVLLYFIFGFLYFNTEIMRESLAVAVFLFSLDAFYNKKWIRYFLFVTVAVLFHSSALILAICPFLYKIKLNKFFLVSIILIIFVSNVLWTIFNDYIAYFSHFLTIGDKVDSYMGNEMYESNINGVIRSLFTYFLIPFIFSVFAFYKTQKSFKEIPFLWFYIVLGVFTIFHQVLFSRLQNYLFFPFIAFVANLCYETSKDRQHKPIRLKNLRLVMLFILLFFGRYYTFFKLDVYEDSFIYERYFPYYSIISEETSPARASLEFYGD